MQGALKVASDLQSEQDGAPNRLRLRRTQRLNNAKQYHHVLNDAKIVMRNGPLRVSAAPNNTSRARLGLVVSKRSAPRAVDRNLVKRTVREWFRKAAIDIDALDVVVALRTLPKSRKQIKDRVKNALTASQQSLHNVDR